MENFTDLIERYYGGEATSSETQLFEQKYKTDADFRQSAQIHAKALEVVRINGRRQLKAMLQEEHKKIAPKPVISWKNRFLTAAAFVGIASAGTWYYMQNHKALNAQEALAELRPLPFPNHLIDVTRSPESPTALEAFFVQYNKQNYKEAAALYHKIPVQERSSSTDFFRANVLLFADSIAQAKSVLEQLAKLPDFDYQSETGYYLAVALLKEGKLQESIPYLEKTAQSSSPKLSKKTSELLKKMAL